MARQQQWSQAYGLAMAAVCQLYNKYVTRFNSQSNYPKNVLCKLYSNLIIAWKKAQSTAEIPGPDFTPSKPPL